MGEPVNGARHDAAAFFISGIAERWTDHLTDGGTGMIGDGGYQGTGPITPHKKPPGGELTAKQKAYNYGANRLRAAVERAISHLKNWKILKIGYHRIMTDFPDMLHTVTALEIFRTTTPGLNDPPVTLHLTRCATLSQSATPRAVQKHTEGQYTSRT
ncbi:transposase family protein [Actinoplanes sp. NPDC051346]|uniref:transposase family protein n=1 Tax=Actinoplanes sp. NPDC051346 TaxID=3155048 RepID=UPI003431D7FE